MVKKRAGQSDAKQSKATTGTAGGGAEKKNTAAASRGRETNSNDIVATKVAPSPASNLGVLARFNRRLRQDPEAFLHVILWAQLAEAVVHTWVPRVAAVLDFGLGEHLMLDVLGIVLNGIGAILAGVATAALSEAPESAQAAGGETPAKQILIAFKGGFVAIFTSFCGLAEQLASAESWGAMLLVASCGMIGGPYLFWGGHRCGELFGAKPLAERFLGSCRASQVIVGACISLTVAAEISGADDGGIALLQGLAFAAAAVCFGDFVAMLLEEVWSARGESMFWWASPLNWATIAGNVLGLLFLVVAAPRAGGMLHGPGCDKFRGTFCGGVSGYGAFSEDVALPIISSASQRREAAMNLLSNAALALGFAAVLRRI